MNQTRYGIATTLSTVILLSACGAPMEEEVGVDQTEESSVELTTPGTRIVAKSANIAPGAWTTVTATCPTGSMVTGGGFANNYDLNLSSMLPNSSNGWSSLFYGGDKGGPVVGQVVCLQGVAGTVTNKQKSITISAGARGCADVTCTSGVALSGGYLVNAIGAQVASSYPSPTNGWTVCAKNSTAISVTLTSSVQCLTGSTATTTQVTSPATTVPAKSVVAANVTCPSGYLVVGGGFQTPGGAVTVHNSAASSTAFQARVHNDGNSSVEIRGVAKCLKP